MYAKIRRLLQYRWCRGAVIPPETRVDPSGFPEAEFPVVCPGCNYLLQGLPNSCCPECGRPFDRGRLLVEQYLLMRVPLSTTGKIARTGAWIGAALTFLSPVIPTIFLYAANDPFSYYRCVLPVAGLLLVLLLLTGACLWVWWREEPRHLSDRKNQKTQVFAALDWEAPVFKRAQRLRWTSLGVHCFAGLVLFVIVANDNPPRSAAPMLIILLMIAQSAWLFKKLRAWGPGTVKESDTGQ